MAYIRRLPSGLWQATVRLPHGRRITQTHHYKRAVEAWATEREREVQNGVVRDPRAGRVTVGQWVRRWHASRQIEDYTRATGLSIIKHQIAPTWEDVPLDAVTSLGLQTWITRLIEDGHSPSTARRAAYMLTAALKVANRDGLILTTPWVGVRKPREVKRLPDWFTHDEVATMSDGLPEPHGTIVLVMAWCGLRFEEAAGLKAVNVDWARRRIRVEDVWTPSGYRSYPKTQASNREVPVPPHVLTRLRGRGEVGLLMPTTYRAFYHAVSTWQRAQDGWRYRTPHVLRHTAASWLVQAGVPLYEVQRLLGHETPAMTAKYAHLAPDAHGRVEEAWEAMPTHL